VGLSPQPHHFERADAFLKQVGGRTLGYRRINCDRSALCQLTFKTVAWNSPALNRSELQ